MDNKLKNKEFLQSRRWAEFQKSVGRRTHFIENEYFSANIAEHSLPIVGKYFYVPRGPILKFSDLSSKSESSSVFRELIDLAKKENAGWIRIDPENIETLEFIKNNIQEKFLKAPHNMQPKEIFVLDITKSKEDLLLEMKSKTRYNINLANKKGVKILEGRKYEEDFLRLTKEMALRQGIIAHPENYYRKMIQSFSEEMLKIYVAEFEGKIIVANILIFFEDQVIYLHGASSNENRSVMAPFLLQWQAILDAKKMGYKTYDFGGVKTQINIDNNGLMQKNSWAGITQFKLGFSPNTKPIVFPGSYDIVLNSRKYAVYRGLQRAKKFAVNFRR